jgi:hypothetical protein
MTFKLSMAGRRTWLQGVAAFLLLLACTPAAAADLVLDQASGAVVEGVINGVPLRLKVEFDHLEGITLNPDAAARAGLGHGDGEWVERIGPVRLEGRRTKLRLTVGGVETRASIRWRDSPAAVGADGIIGVHTLPFDSVEVQRAAARPGERELSFQTRLHDNHGVHYRLRVGKHRIAVRFSLSRPRTTAPAAAAAVIAEQQGGHLGDDRSVEEIALGVERPVRTLRLGTPLALGGLRVPALMARTADFRGGHQLAWAEPPSRDGEIVVTGARDSQEALYRITLGLDVLGRCSSATYRRSTGELRLRCAQD